MDSESKPPSSSTPVWVVVVAVIALAATIGAAVISKYYRSPNVQLVDINIIDKPKVATHNGLEMSRYGLSDLQILIKNGGDGMAIVSSVELEIKHIWNLILQFSLNFFQESSHEYSVELDPTRTPPYTLMVPVAQSLKGDESDRIDVSIGLNPMKPFENIYHVSVRLVYNTDKRTDQMDVVLVLPDEETSQRSYFLSEYLNEMDQMESIAKSE